jgi:hypothetical protein
MGTSLPFWTGLSKGYLVEMRAWIKHQVGRNPVNGGAVLGLDRLELLVAG